MRASTSNIDKAISKVPDPDFHSKIERTRESFIRVMDFLTEMGVQADSIAKKNRITEQTRYNAQLLSFITYQLQGLWGMVGFLSINTQMMLRVQSHTLEVEQYQLLRPKQKALDKKQVKDMVESQTSEIIEQKVRDLETITLEMITRCMAKLSNLLYKLQEESDMRDKVLRENQ